MKKILVSGLLLITFCCAATDIAAQQVRAYLSADSVRVGDRFSLTLVAEHQFENDPVFPGAEAGAEFFGDLEVLTVESAGAEALGAPAGARVDSLIYEVTTFALDTAYVPSIPVFFVAGADTSFFASYPIELPIISLVPEGTEEIRDLAPIAEFPINPWPWILGVLLVALLTAALYFYWKKRRERLGSMVIAAPEPEISPLDQAIQRLRELEKSANLQDVAQVKPFYVELTEILRVYLGRKLRIDAMESTSRELMWDLEKIAKDGIIQGETVKLAKRILDVSDLVKFADMVPAPEVGHQAFRETRKVLDEVEASVRPPEPVLSEASPQELSEDDAVMVVDGDTLASNTIASDTVASDTVDVAARREDQ